MRHRLGFFLAVVILSAAVLGGLLGDRVSAGAPLEKDTKDLLKTFTEVLATVQEQYVEKITSEEMVESAIRAMLRTLDPHSAFFSRSDYHRLQEEQQGKYYGLGITIRAEAPGSGRVLVVEPPAPGTPAYKVGLRAGDVISRIEGKPIDDWDLNEEVIPNLKGPKGTTVNITVERPGEPQPLELTVERDEIPIHTIKYAFLLRPGLGYIRIDRFAETTGKELEEALRELRESQLEGLILDLRDDPGGALSQAIEVGDQFLDKGQVIVSTRSRQGKVREYKARRQQRYHYPMVVLINANSASASEIVAGALQDHDRALLIGETTFGKALVQTIYSLEDNRGLALTTGKYYTPSDRLIQRDYSASFWDYYNNRGEQAREERETFRTAAGRIVYGGGGITPDETVELDHYSKFARQIVRKGLFREFASTLHRNGLREQVNFEHTPEEVSRLDPAEKSRIADYFEVPQSVLETFSAFLSENDIEFSRGEFEQDEKLIRTRIKQELLLLLLGDEESYRVALELDKQVQAAIKALPKAQALLQNPLALNQGH